MKKLPIADCQWPVRKSFSGCGFARCRHDGGEVAGLLQERRQLSGGHGAGFDKQFEPQRGFVGFFPDGSDFGDEFSVAARTSTGAVIRRHRGAAANDLPGNDTSGIVAFWNRPRQLDDSQGKGFGACFQFGWIHGRKLPTQSAIGNRQPAIQR
jgi:hypothetical protein